MNVNPQDLVRRYLPGWRVAATHSSEDTGALVTVQRFDTDKRILDERTVWISVDGEPVNARIDGQGYIVTSDGRRF